MKSTVLDLALEQAHRYLDGLDDRPVAATVSREELLARFDVPLGRAGLPAEQVVADLVHAADGGQLGNVGGRFFAWVIGGTLPSALAADWLTSTWDQNAAIYGTSPAASVVEEIAGKWLLDVLRLPPTASFAFTTGCQMAHFTALAAARDFLLGEVGWKVGEQGLAGSPPIRVLASAVRHVSVDRALRYLGVGARQIVVLPVDGTGTITPQVLNAALAAGEGPTIVALNAADLNTGAFDPFATLIPLAQSHGAWVHVDGAFGLFARASERYALLVKGMDLADSWATDCHKWLNVPQDCGFAAVRHAKAHRGAFTIHDSYFVDEQAARDQIDWTPEWSRRARGFGVYAALRELGRDGLAALIERNCDQCDALVRGVGALPGAEVLFPARLNQGLVRFLDPRPEATPADHDAYTDRIVESINDSGEAFFGGVTWNGRRAMRISVVNWRTTEADVERTVAAVARVLADDRRR
ncbi:MAG TPA: aminotransferase class V-fold PLP-dependent enzyme [Thermoanaerobaculia bacterium]|jgi:aromatic-L-amino-acid decarboxylase|nr:aminotransferase class V-fold PLP-dependent enzyme [Thermoanaerobaculia bacterium]